MAKSGYRTYMYTCNEAALPSHFQTRNKIDAYLSDNMPNGTQWAWICHDKDVYTAEDDKATDGMHAAGTPKAPHLHISIYLPNTKTITAMAKALGDPRPQNVQKFTGDNAKQNLFSYLVHRTEGSKADGKHVYDYEEVSTNFDYRAYVEGVKNAIASSQVTLDEVQEKIMNGDLRFIDFVMQDEWTSFYLKRKSFVTSAIDTLYKRRMNDRHDDKVRIIYIQGDAGSGKSKYARIYALKNYRDYCVSSSSNDSAQDYLGQDVMIFDDARPGDFTASEWLKLLDPYNNESTINSRYYNKYLAVKCIILTSVTPFEDFFVYAPKKESDDLLEPVGQFMRRFDAVLYAKSWQQADILYTGIDIHSVQPCQEYKRYVGGRDVPYVYRVSDKPIKHVDEMIAQLHASDTEALLDTF